MNISPILSNQFMESHLDQEKSLLTTHWFPSTYDLEEDKYKKIVLEIADLVQEKRIKRWISYGKDFAFVISPELQEWVYSEFHQKLVQGGLQKVAVVIPSDYIANLSVKQTVGEIEKNQLEVHLELRNFDEPKQAEAWLLEG